MALEDRITLDRVRIVKETNDGYFVKYGKQRYTIKRDPEQSYFILSDEDTGVKGSSAASGAGPLAQSHSMVQMQVLEQRLEPGIFQADNVPKEFKEVMIFHELREREYLNGGLDDAHYRAVNDEILYVTRFFDPEKRVRYFEFADKFRKRARTQMPPDAVTLTAHFNTVGFGPTVKLIPCAKPAKTRTYSSVAVLTASLVLGKTMKGTSHVIDKEGKKLLSVDFDASSLADLYSTLLSRKDFHNAKLVGDAVRHNAPSERDLEEIALLERNHYVRCSEADAQSLAQQLGIDECPLRSHVYFRLLRTDPDNARDYANRHSLQTTEANNTRYLELLGKSIKDAEEFAAKFTTSDRTPMNTWHIRNMLLEHSPSPKIKPFLETLLYDRAQLQNPAREWYKTKLLRVHGATEQDENKLPCIESLVASLLSGDERLAVHRTCFDELIDRYRHAAMMFYDASREDGALAIDLRGKHIGAATQVLNFAASHRLSIPRDLIERFGYSLNSELFKTYRNLPRNALSAEAASELVGQFGFLQRDDVSMELAKKFGLMKDAVRTSVLAQVRRDLFTHIGLPDAHAYESLGITPAERKQIIIDAVQDELDRRHGTAAIKRMERGIRMKWITPGARNASCEELITKCGPTDHYRAAVLCRMLGDDARAQQYARLELKINTGGSAHRIARFFGLPQKLAHRKGDPLPSQIL